MKETIYTIPINEAFAPKCGCPMCTLEKKLESDALEYIMGAAMMEPDVREETNRLGFCAKHYEDMLMMKNRLSLALMLESRFGELSKLVESMYKNGTIDPKKAASALSETADSCFVCKRIADFMDHYYKNVVYMWKGEEQFRESFASQERFCLKHTARLLEYGSKGLGKKEFIVYADALMKIQKAYMDKAAADVKTFCQSFDYRYAGKDIGDAKYGVERAVHFLSASEKALELTK